MSQSLSPGAAIAAQTSPTPTKYGGVYPAKVYATNDPKNAGRIQMYIPQIFGAQPVKIWAPPLVAGNIPPTVGTIVWCLFQGGDPAYPTYLPPLNPASGAFGSGAHGSDGYGGDIVLTDSQLVESDPGTPSAYLNVVIDGQTWRIPLVGPY